MSNDYYSIRQLLDKREQYLSSMKLYQKMLTEADSIRKEKETMLENILGKSNCTLTIENITSSLESKELAIPMKHIPDMDDSDRRYLIVQIAKTKLIISELEKKIMELNQQA